MTVVVGWLILCGFVIGVGVGWIWYHVGNGIYVSTHGDWKESRTINDQEEDFENEYDRDW